MTATISPEEVIGKVKKMGAYGPIYQVTKQLRRTNDGDVLMEIILLESNQVIEYPLSGIEIDPEAK